MGTVVLTQPSYMSPELEGGFILNLSKLRYDKKVYTKYILYAIYRR